MQNNNNRINTKMYDVAIIGGGPAGIAAGIQASRLGLKTLLFEKVRLGGQVNIANLIENFPGSPPLPGKEFIKPWTEQLKKTSTEIIYEEVIEVDCHAPPGLAMTVKSNHHLYQTKNIIIATGAIPRKINISNVHYYADPDLVEHEGKDVAIIGGGDAAFDQALNFSKKAKSVSIMMRSEQPRALKLLVERAKQKKINIITGTKINPEDLIIACIGKEARSNLIDVNNPPDCLFIAGDCHRPAYERQIAIAMSDGIRAAIEAASILNSHQSPPCGF